MPELRTRLAFLPIVAYVVEVTVLAMAAAWIAALPMHSVAVSVASGVTVGWLAGIYLPCPCHRHGGHR